MERSSPRMLFSIMDLPTLVLPTIAKFNAPAAGSSASSSVGSSGYGKRAQIRSINWYTPKLW